MKKIKPMDPRAADRLSCQIMAENAWMDKTAALWASQYFLSLPEESAQALRCFVLGLDFDESLYVCELFDNLPTYEFAEFDRKFGHMRRTAQRMSAEAISS